MTSKEALDKIITGKIYYMEDLDIIEQDLSQLQQYKNIEQELGVDLITLFKAVEQERVWTKFEDVIDVCDNVEYMLGEWFIYFYWNNGKRLVFQLSDYGTKWALTRKELE